jgi:ketosteroid isomerase-like protein
MRKSQSIVCMSLLTVSLMIPIGRAYAGGNPPGNHREREELRRDQRQLEDLRRQRNRELRQGDRREARVQREDPR